MPPLLNSDQLAQRLGHFEPQQIAAWRTMTPVEQLAVAFEAYQFALDAVRLTEQRQAAPDLPEESFRWRVTRRMQGDQTLGRER